MIACLNSLVLAYTSWLRRNRSCVIGDIASCVGGVIVAIGHPVSSYGY